MISPDRFREEREAFFTGLGKRIRGIALAKDTVIPYHGILEALGSKTGEAVIQHIDFDYPYTHENPFPHNSKDTSAVNSAFQSVFSRAAAFLG